MASLNVEEPSRKPGNVARVQRRGALLDAMADHLLLHGLAGSPLRALAASAGTSDRMLLYYFADRDELLTALLEHVAVRLAHLLSVGHREKQPYEDLLAELWSLARQQVFRPFMLLFLELAAAAGRGEEPHRTAASKIASGFIGWIEQRLTGNEADGRRQAALLLATLDGLFLLHSAGCSAEAEAAAQLASAIIPKGVTTGRF